MDEIDDMIAQMRRSYIEVGEEINPQQSHDQQSSKNSDESKIVQQPVKTYNIKLNLRDGFRRIQLHQCSFNALQQAIIKLYPDFRGGHCFYRDDEGDKIMFETDAEMLAMFHLIEANNKWKPESDDTAKIIVEEFEKASTDTPKLDQTPQTNKNNNNNKVLHPHIICDGCDGSVIGHRYKCLVCPDFDLCERCEHTGLHTQHAMMRLVTPNTERPPCLMPFCYPRRCLRNLIKADHHEERWLKKQPELGEHILHHKYQHHHKHHHGVHTTNDSSMQAPDNRDRIAEQLKRKHEQKLEKIGKKYAKQEQRCRDRVFRTMHRMERQAGSQPLADETSSNVNSGVEYLKHIGQHLQHALLNYGIDCEATVKDRDGNVQEHMPFIDEQQSKPVANQQNDFLNQISGTKPAGVFERPQLANIQPKPKTSKAEKKKCKLTELKDAIQKADHLVTERKRAAAVETEQNGKKKKENGVSAAKQQTMPSPPQKHSPSSSPQNPILNDMLAQAVKAATDAIETATKVTSDVIKGFDPAAGDKANQFSKTLVDEAKLRTENLLTNIDQSPLFTEMFQQFLYYLEQIQFPVAQQHQTDGLQQNTTPPPANPNENNEQANQQQKCEENEDEKMNIYQTSTEKGNGNLVGQLNQLSLNNVEMAEEKKNIEEGSQKKSENTEEKIISQEIELHNEQAVQEPTKRIEDATNLALSRSNSLVSLDVDTVDGSDVEILNDNEREEETTHTTIPPQIEPKEVELEVEPSLPGSSNVSTNGSLKRNASEQNEYGAAVLESLKQQSLTDSVHTAIGIDEVVNEVITQNMQKFLQNDGRKVKSVSRSSSISSLRSSSSTTSSSTSDSGWMVVKKESFKRLCDFYEKRRRMEAPDGHGDTFAAQLHKEREEALNQKSEDANMVDNNEQNVEQLKPEMVAKERRQQQNEGIIVDISEEKRAGNESKEIDENNKKLMDEMAPEMKQQPQEDKQQSEPTNSEKVQQPPKEKNVRMNSNDSSANRNSNNNNNPRSTKNTNDPNNIPFYVADIVANLLGVPVSTARNSQSPNKVPQQQQQQGAQPSAPPFHQWNWPPRPSAAMLAAQSLANNIVSKNFEIPVNDKNAAPIPMPAPPSPTKDNNGSSTHSLTSREGKPAVEKKDSTLYPDLLVAAANLDEICTAGAPHPRGLNVPSGSRHTRRCPWPHFDSNVQRIADQLVAMGYDNCNGWLYRLAEQTNCELDRVFELIEVDQQHKERQFLADM